MTQRVHSYQVADAIDIKRLKEDYKAELQYSDEAELFYRVDPNQYIYIFKYGAVCFLNCSTQREADFLKYLSGFARNPFSKPLEEVYEVETDAPENRIGFQKVEIMTSDPRALRLIMLNVTQSVALDYYADQMRQLLEGTNHHTQILEARGHLDIGGKKLKKYIGRTLLIRNRIAENLYIFDSPDETWEDEGLDKLDTGMKRNFDLQQRVRNIHEGLSIIKDNLGLFQAMLQNRNSTMLEWIIIILIMVEVINLFIEKVF